MSRASLIDALPVTTRARPKTGTDSAVVEPVKKPSPYSVEFEEWWKAYPRHEVKFKAFGSWKKAIAAIMQSQDVAMPTAVSWLLSVTLIFRDSERGKSGEFCPHATTWLNQRRYEDDPKVWGKANGQTRTHNPGTSSSLADWIAAQPSEGMASQCSGRGVERSPEDSDDSAA
jgi:hypothetical protein